MDVLHGAGTHIATAGDHWAEHLRVDDLSCGTYSLAAGATDPQEPHTEDEIYICTTGRATLWTPDATAEMTPGVVTFVPAREEHRFIDIVEDFTALVVFAPPEGSRAT
jgi:mannose-6-phosphate isomerase-like protein (cupin superfamily)